MATRLYVGNLSNDATAEALRLCFAACGTVVEVDVVVDRMSGHNRGHAFVTMQDNDGALRAIDELNGSLFDERPLRVNEATDVRVRGEAGREAAKEAAKALKRVRVMAQFRERTNMTYEVDCSGVLLSFKVYFTESASGDAFRVEARVKSADESTAIAGLGESRRAAFDNVVRDWSEKPELPAVDFPAIALVLSAVKAL
jgi:RNA recognition motif-containing protein